ncbi:MAG: spermidine synthase [Polaribacter sp.]|jgi:spermidine synthase
MIPWTLLGTAEIPNNGGRLKLTQRENEFSIHLTGVRGELMNSRVHSSELALAELGCAPIKNKENAHILVGGLGMGFTLSSALDSVSPSSTVVVAELVPEVLEWNRGVLGECAGRPLDDSRTQIYLGDVAQLLTAKRAKQTRKNDYDAILLDIDNGPEGFTHSDNDNLYSLRSLQAIRKALNVGGILAIWSAWADPLFILQLKKARFKVENHTVRAHKGAGSRHTIYLAKKTVI